jgi:hypothetical protein
VVVEVDVVWASTGTVESDDLLDLALMIDDPRIAAAVISAPIIGAILLRLQLEPESAERSAETLWWESRLPLGFPESPLSSDGATHQDCTRPPSWRAR